jgi:hypothetical protein
VRAGSLILSEYNIAKVKEIYCASVMTVLVAGSYYFELKVQLGNSLRNLLQICNKKYTFFQTRYGYRIRCRFMYWEKCENKSKNGFSPNSLIFVISVC